MPLEWSQIPITAVVLLPSAQIKDGITPIPEGKTEN